MRSFTRMVWAALAVTSLPGSVIVVLTPKARAGSRPNGNGRTMFDPLELKQPFPSLPPGQAVTLPVTTPYEARNAFGSQRGTFRACNIDPASPEVVVEFRASLGLGGPAPRPQAPAPAPTGLQVLATQANAEYSTGVVHMRAQVKNLGTTPMTGLTAALVLTGPDLKNMGGYTADGRTHIDSQTAIWLKKTVYGPASLAPGAVWEISETYRHPAGASMPRGNLKVDVQPSSRSH